MREEGIKVAKKNNMKYWEVSARSGANINEVIKNLTLDVYKVYKDKSVTKGVKLSNKKNKESCC